MLSIMIGRVWLKKKLWPATVEDSEDRALAARKGRSKQEALQSLHSRLHIPKEAPCTFEAMSLKDSMQHDMIIAIYTIAIIITITIINILITTIMIIIMLIILRLGRPLGYLIFSLMPIY